jgi:glycosyltransferase involved in cell wall biosynthesis
MKDTKQTFTPRTSTIAVRAWNEEAAIRATLDSLLQQSLFEVLSKRQEGCEVLGIANGCIDRTAGIAAEAFEEEQPTHPLASAFTRRVAEIAKAGRNNTWNAFIQSLSHRGDQVPSLMHSDIVFSRADTLANMYAALLNKPRTCIASDRQHKETGFKNKKSLRDRISLATSNMTGTIEGQITGQA